jgi:hypothetical protein
MTIDTKNAPLALEMIKAELGGRPTMNTLQTFLLIAEYERGDARDLERLLKATSGTVACPCVLDRQEPHRQGARTS